MTPRRPLAERVVTAAYRVALRIYPRSFRVDFAGDMLDTFLDRYREARRDGALRTLGFLAAAASDVVANGLRERVDPHPFGHGMFHWADLRYALRLLRRSPAFSTLTTLTLAGGLGVSIFTFAFLHRAMLRPLPLPGGERIVRIDNAAPGTGGVIDVVDLAAIRPSLTTVSILGAYENTDAVIGDERHRRVLATVSAEPNIFDATHTRPILGRVFRPEDQAAGAEPVVVLEYRAWQLAFGGDSAIVGTTVPFNSGSARIIGVMPDGYGFPVAAEAWVPLPARVLDERVPNREGVRLYAVMAEGANAAAVRTQAERLLDRARDSRRTSITAPDRATVAVRTFPMAQIGDEAPLVLAVLNLLAGLILLLACINVTNLLLARANERVRETAVRLALGASRGRLVVQSVWENAMICLGGGVVAIGIAAFGLDTVNAWLQSNLQGNLPFWWEWHLDRDAVFAACGFVTAALGLVVALVTAGALRTEFGSVLRDGGAGGGNRREGRLARGLVVTQIVAVTVLMFFGVMASVVAYRVAHVSFGYDTTRLLASSVELPPERYADEAGRRAFYERLVATVGARASVDGVLLRATIGRLDDDRGAVDVATGRAEPGPASPHAYVAATLGPMTTFGLALRGGRFFDGRDDERATPVAIVSHTLAEQLWPGRSPIGERIRLAADSGRVGSREVVGVVSDILMGQPFAKARSTSAVYVPLRQVDARSATLFFRHRGDVPAAQAALHVSLAEIDPRFSPPSVTAYEEVLTKSSLIAVSVTKLFALCFGFALLLAVSGTYGLMARSIGRRTREIGVRRALGATDGMVAGLLIRQGGRQLGVGVLIALPLIVAVGVGFAAFFPVGVATTIVAGAGVSAAMIGAVMLATYLPTRRALAVSPRDALWRD